jgi:hypothetical protein
VPFDITNSRDDWVKVNDKQRLSSLSVCFWFVTIMSNSSITLVKITKKVSHQVIQPVHDIEQTLALIHA